MAQRRRPKASRKTEQAKRQVKRISSPIVLYASKINKSAKKYLPAKMRNKAVDKSDKLKVYSNMPKSSKRKAKKDLRARKKAEYLATLPKNPFKRFLYRLHPKRFFKYWFSKRGAIMALKLSGAGVALFVITVIGLFAWFRKDLPDPNDIGFTESTKFFDRTGEHLLFELYGEQNRTLLEFDEISDYAKWATIAIEDKDFYQHGGFSVTGIARAAWSNLTSGDATGQGGSTITQQFIKNSLLTSEQTVTRKIKELILAIELERLYTKDEILTFYLNEIPYGTQAYGIEAAAQSFFDKPASDLTIDESAMLAALPQAPSLYSPYIGDRAALTARKYTIIDLMAEQGYITTEEAEEAKKVKTLRKLVSLEDRSLYRGVIAPHFIDETKRRLETEFGEALVATGGLNVTTTLDFDLQKTANKAMRENFKHVQNPLSGGGSGDNAALSATDVETGQVLAQVGSRGYNYKGYGAFNAAAPAVGRQPGSSFKPYTYAQLFENPRWSPGSIIWDTNTTFGDYKPNNFDFGFPGPMKVREALGRSRNIPAVKALYISGVDNVINLSHNMGLESLCLDCAYGLSLVLGSGEVKLDEHTNAYATFARGGVYRPNTYILNVTNAAGEELLQWRDDGGEQVLDPEQAYLVTHMLIDDQARSGTFGLGNPRLVVPGLNHAVKTGTTDRSVDGWMMGYTTCLAVGVWAGNHDSKPMDTITSWQTGPMWTQFMKQAHEQRPCEDPEFKRPDGIKNVRIDTKTGRNTESGGHSDIAASWFEGVDGSKEKKVTVDKISGYLATECTPERAKEEKTNSKIAHELEPEDIYYVSWARSAGYTASQTQKKDDIHLCSDDKPTVSLDVNKLINGVYRFTANVGEGTHNMDTLNFKVNGSIVSSQSVKNSGSFDYTHVFNSTGSYDVTAEVIDSVLYEDSHTQSVTVSDVQGDPTITTPTESSSVNAPTTVQWTNLPGEDEFSVCFKPTSGSWNCSTTSADDTSETISTSPSGSYQVYVIAWYSGIEIGRSQTINFSTNP